MKQRVWILLAFLLAVALPVSAQTQHAFTGFCDQGGVKAVTSGLGSTNFLDGVIPSCTVTVYLSGTHTLATLTTNGTVPLANPFTANALGAAAPGQWLFYAADGQAYDAILSGGIAPNVYLTPVPIVGLFHASGGGGGSGGCSTGGIATTNGSVDGDNTSTNCGYQNRTSDTASVPANVSTFGYQNGASNAATNVVAVGNTTAAGVTAGGSNDLVAIGDFALDCKNLRCYEGVAIGDSAANLTAGHYFVGIGSGALANSFVDNTIAIGQGAAATSSADTAGPGSTANVVALGNGAVFLHGSTNPGDPAISSISDVIGIGDGSSADIQGVSHDVVGIGNGAGSNWLDGTHDVIGIGDGASTGAVSLGVPTAAATDIVGVGDGVCSHLGNGSANVFCFGARITGSGTITNAIGIGNNVTLGSNQTVIGNASITNLKLFGCPSGQAVLTDGSGTCYTPGAGGGVTSINSATGAFTFVGSGVSCTGTSCTFSTGGITGSGTLGFVPKWTTSSNLGNSALDDGVTTASTITSTEPVTVAAASLPSQMSMTYNAGHAPTVGSATTAVHGVDSSGHAVVSEAGQPFAEECTATNSACASPQIKYASVVCPSGGLDLNTGLLPSGSAGTDETSCINAVLAAATPTAPIVYVNDVGGQLVTGIVGPAEGGWSIVGTGAGVQRVQITAYSITSNVVTFTTAASNNLTANQTVQLGNFGTATFFNGQSVKVISTGLSSTQFEASFTHANASATENGEADSLIGSGFYLASTSNNNVISNTAYIGDPNTAAPSRGAGFQVRNIAINGNAANNTSYRYGIAFTNARDVLIDGVTLYNVSKYHIMLSNASNSRVINSNIYAEFPNQPAFGSVNHQDGIHVDGPAAALIFSGMEILSGDDPIALNAPEGYCGAISNVEMSNVTILSQTPTLGRIDPGAACVSGVIPTVSNVTIANFNDTSGLSGFILGNEGALSGLANSINGLKVTNSFFSSPQGFIASDSGTDITLDNVTWTPTCNTCGLFMTGGGGTFTLGGLIENNVTIKRTNGSQTGVSFVDTATGDGAGAATPTFTLLSLNGLQIVDQGSYANSTYILHMGASNTTVSHLFAQGYYTQNNAGLYDPALAAHISDTGNYNFPGQILAQTEAISSAQTGSGFIAPAYYLVPNISSGAHVGNFFGQSFADSDTCYTALHWLGHANTSNTLSLGCFSHDDLLTIDMNGNTTFDGGTNTIYRCTVAGTLPVGALTTTSGDCGTAVDTKLRIN